MASDLRRPGHVLPLRARPGGVIERPGHTEAAVDLCRLAGLPPVGMIAELVTDPDEPGAGATAQRTEIAELGRRHDLPLLDVADLVRHRLFYGDGLRGRVTRGARAALPIAHGGFNAVAFRDEVTGAEHVALLGPSSSVGRPLIAVHIECIAGHVFGSQACHCRRELQASLAAVARTSGAVVYLRRAATGAHALSGGHDTGVAGADMHAAAAAILADLGLAEVRLRARGTIDVSTLATGGINAVAV